MLTIRQYKMLRLFKKENFSITEALKLNQRTFGSLCKRGLVEYSLKYGFVLTENGESVLDAVQFLVMTRKIDNGRFSSYVPKVRKLLVMRKSA